MHRGPTSLRSSKFQAHSQRIHPYYQTTSLSVSPDERTAEHFNTLIETSLSSPCTPPRTPPPLSHSPTSTPCTSAESTPTRPRSESPVSQPASTPDSERVRRPANPFILFACHYRKGHKGKNNRDLSREAGLMWKELGAEEKQTWKKLAAEVKAKHAEEHPDYRYKPRRRETPRRKIRFEGDIRKSRVGFSERTLDLFSPCSSAECSPVRRRAQTDSLMPEGDDFDALPASPLKGTDEMKGQDLNLFMSGWIPEPFQSSSQTPVQSPERPSSRLPKSENGDQESHKVGNDLFSATFYPTYHFPLQPSLTQQYYHYSCEPADSSHNASLPSNHPSFDTVIDFVYPNTVVQDLYGHEPKVQVYSDPCTIYGTALDLADAAIFSQPQIEPGLPEAAEQPYHVNVYPFIL